MYYYLDTVLRLWHFTGAEREAREFRRKLVYKTGFCMRYLLRADRPKLSSSPLSCFSFTSIIYASARALRSETCKQIFNIWRSRPTAACERSGPARRRNCRVARWPPAGPRSRAATSWPNVPRPVDGTRTDGDGWALSGRRGGRLYKLYRIPARPLKPFLLSSRAR